MKKYPTLIATTLLLLTAVPVLASADHGHNRGHISDRLERQSNRIREGARNGALTHRETRVLRREQKDIRRMVRRMRDDNGLSRKERRKINKRLDKAGRHIRKLKHNDVYRERRYGRYPYHNRDEYRGKYRYGYHDDHRYGYGEGESLLWLGYYGGR